MDKLFSLKEWLTVPEAARHLSIILNEEVSEADVLRLCLDGHLVLSVYFVNHANAKLGKVVKYEDVEWGEYTTDMLEFFSDLPEGIKDNQTRYIKSLNLGNERYLNLSDKITTIAGVWDLPMIGNERLDVEHMYQNLTGGPAVTLQGLDGAFVEEQNGPVCQLQESFDSNEYHLGSIAALKRIREYIDHNNIEGQKAQELLDEHKEQRKAYLEAKKLRNYADDFYPAGALPDDSVLVLRTTALREFEESLRHENSQQKAVDSLPEAERNSLLKLVLGMAISKYGYDPDSARNAATGDNKGSIAIDLSSNGLSMDSDTVRKYINEAKAVFKD